MEQSNGEVEAIRKAAESLRARFDKPGANEELDEAVNNAGNILDALDTQDKQTHVVEHLNIFIQAADMILPAVPIDYPDRVAILSDISIALGRRFERMGPARDIEDINRAIELAQAAVDLTPQGDIIRLWALSNLGHVLDKRYIWTRNLEDIKLEVEKAQDAVRTMPDCFSHAYLFQNQLAVSLGKLFDRTSDLEIIERAIAASNKAVDGTPKGDHMRPFYLNTQARLLGMRFEQTGVPGDLNLAIDILNDSLPLLQVGDPNRVIGVNYLGILTGIRFEQQGDIEDLEAAIKCSEEALATVTERSLERPGVLSNLANRLARRAQRNKDLKDIDCAINYINGSLRIAPHDHPERAKWLGNLGSFFGMRSELETKSPSSSRDLNQAIGITKDAIKLTKPEDPGLGDLTNTIANLLRSRSKQNRSVNDLDEAVDALEKGLKLLPTCHPHIAILYHNLGETLHERYNRTKKPADFDRSIAVFQKGWTCENALITLRIDLAVKIAELLVSIPNWEEVTMWLKRAVDLLHVLSPRYLQNTDKQHMIQRFAGLAGSTAAAMLNAGKDASYALQYLELGRGIISGLLLDLRTDLSSLRQEYPYWAAQVSQLRDRLDSPCSAQSAAPEVAPEAAPPTAPEATPSVPPPTDTNSPAQNNTPTSQPSSQTSNAGIITTESGSRDFLLPPTVAKMMEAANPHPIVVLNASPFRCDAFIVKPHQITVQPLPDLTLESINDKIKQMRTDSYSLSLILEWLWDIVVHPILKALGFDNQPLLDNKWPHIWWVPVGPLSYLPFHAAGYHEKDSGETTLDRIISSYSSSIKSLISGRHQQSSRRTPARALLVSMPNTPGQVPLQFTKSEVEVLDGLLPSLHMTSVKPERMRKADVISQLGSCDIFHFAGHGISHPLEPSRSSLLLEDWKENPLTVGDLRDQKLQDKAPFLAYLSACSTSANDILGLSDEAIHLVNVCQLAGFRHVIGTLWTVSDMACVGVARRLYETIRDEATDESVCRGLHFALRELRDTQNDSDDNDQAEQAKTKTGQGEDGRGGVVAGLRPYNLLWVPYVHLGV
ncbi:hypothetical protein V491_00438 [Pseudogymnoascus sp. VKM F-3775]|nr:hypothetical protein V491_00438 [Pseudogymnoascus sp. VKM F-3775]